MAKDLWDMTDEELEAAFKEAKAEIGEDVNLDTTEYDFGSNDEDDTIEYDDLEQPGKDSDNDTSSTEEEEEESEDDSEPADKYPDGDATEEEEQTETEEKKSDKDEQPIDKIGESLEEFFSKQSKVRANGVDYSFSNKEKLEMFDKIFPQAADYTKKMQAMKPYRKRIDYMEQVNMTDSEFNFLMDLSKGDKAAITELIKRTGVDALELDTENNNYIAKNYGRDDTELDIREVVSGISNDKEYSTTYNILNSQWDESSRSEFLKEPKKIAQLHEDVKSGFFDIINPIAQKLKLYDGSKKSDLDYYGIAADQYFTQLEQQQETTRKNELAAQMAKAQEAEKAKISTVKAKQAQRENVAKEADKRKAAAPTNAKKAGTKAVNWIDDLEENYDDWRAKLDARQ